jgi:multiple sugar transport system permease protein
MAASSVIVIPMIILFILARKYIVSGVSRGGLKG